MSLPAPMPAIAADLADVLAQFPQLVLALLFGSVALGKERPDSDLDIAVQLCVDIGAHLLAGSSALAPNTMGLTFEALAQAGVLPADLALKLKKAVGFRNIAVHNYDAINWHIVHSIVTDHLADFSAFAEIVSQKLNQP